MPKNPHSSTAPVRKASSAKKRPTKAAKAGLEVLEGRIAPASAFSTAILSLNPEAYYQLGEASGANAVDSSSHNHTGTYVGTPLYGQTGAPQVTDTTAIGFNGSSYVDVPLSVSTDFTIAAWVKTTQTAGSGNWYNGIGLIDGEVGGVTNDFGTALLNGGHFAFGVGNADFTIASSQSINDGSWHFVVATRNATTGAMNVYVDGALGGSGTGPTGTKASPPKLRIGGMQTGVSSFVGTMDDVALFTTELNATQISSLYSASLQSTTDIGLSGSDLVITDGNGGNSDDNLQLKVVGGALQITDLGGAILNVTGISGSTGSGTATVTVPLNAWSGVIQLNTLAGNDTVTLDLSGGDFIYTGVTFNGGDPTAGPGDSLAIKGGNQGTVTYNYTNAHDGNIVMSNYGTVTYTGLEPISNDGTATDVVFNLPAVANTVTLSDVSPSNTLTRLSGANFETTDFANPTNSITINRGTASDTIQINAVPDLTSSITIGTSTSPFATVTHIGAISLAAGKSLTEYADSLNLSSGSITANAASVNLNGDSISIAIPVSAPSGSIKVAPLSSGTQILVGGADAAGVLGLSNTDLSFINTSSLQIGGTISGAVSYNFSSTSLPSGLDQQGPTATYNGSTVSFDGTNDAGRTYVQDLTNHFGESFTAEVTVILDSDAIAYYGMGNGARNPLWYNEPTPPEILTGLFGSSVNSGRIATSDRSVNQNDNGTLVDVAFPGTGTHRVRMIWDATTQNMTFQYDVNYTGSGFTADYTSPAVYGGDNSFPGNPSHVFFGGQNGVQFDDLVITSTGKPVVTVTAATLTSAVELSGSTINLNGLANSGNIVQLTGAVVPSGSGVDVTASTVQFSSGSTLNLAISGATVDTQYTQLNVAGGVNLTNSTLILSGAYTPAPGERFLLVNNDGTDAVTGTFAGLPEGSVITFNGVQRKITYVGGTGNDVELLPLGSLSPVLAGGNLTITDNDPTGKVNNITVIRSGGNLIITDATEQFDSAPAGGTLSNGNRTLTIPIVAGSLTINTGGANDTLTVDLSGGDAIPNGGIVFNGGNPTTAPGDKLTILGGAQGTVTYDYQNAHDGSIQMSNFGSVTYTGLEPITNSGSATDIIFNLPKLSPNAATLANFGTNIDGLSVLSGSTFESTTFANPSGSVTINRGTASDTLGVGALPDLTASLTIGAAITPFAGVTFDGAFTLAADKSLAAFALGDIALTTAASDLAVQGTGTVLLTAGKSVSVTTNASIAVVNGGLTLSANAAGTGAGNFAGIDLNGSLSSTGTGAISLSGTGGNTGGANHGIYIGRVSAGSISSTGGGIVTLTGTGGQGASGDNDGIIVERASSISSNGNLTLTGTVGVAGAGQNEGLNFDFGDTVTATGSATITFITDQGFLLRNATINAGSNTVTLKQKTAGTAIDVGTYAFNIAGISEQTLDSITAGTVQIGDASSGAITVSSAITHGNNLSFTTGAGVTVNVPVAMAANKNFTVQANSAINLATANSDLSSSGTGAISLNTAQNIVLATGSSIATGSGAVTLSANPTGASAGNFVGIAFNGASVTSATGNISITGRGGAGGGRGIDYNATATSITTAGSGTITILATSTNSDGIYMESAAHVIQTQNGNLSVTGTTATAAAGAEGISFFSATANQMTVRSTGSGNVTLTGGTGGGASDLLVSGMVLSTGAGGNINLVTNVLDISASATVSTPGTVSVQPLTTGRAITLGADVAGALGILDVELDRITAGTIQIGSATSGAITVNAPITHLDASAISLTAGTGLNVNLNASVTTAGGSITFGNSVAVGATSALDTTNANALPAGAAINIPNTVNLGANLLTLNAGATNYAINGVISGSGGQLTKQGTGTLTLSNSNTYSGATNVNAGTLLLQNNYGSTSYTISSGAVLELNATVTRDYTTSTTFSGTGTLRKTGAGTALWGVSGATFALSAGALIDVQGGILVGGSSSNEVWTSNASDLNVAGGATFSGVEANVRVDKITGAGTISSGYPGGGYSALTIGVNGGSSTFVGTLSDNAGFIGNFVKAGAGTITLSNAQTYTGTTAVNGGVLSVNSTVASSAVTVASTATLNGTGTIAGTVSVSTGGTIAPGLSTGIISTGALNLASGSNYSVEVNSAVPGTGHDQTNVTGTVSLNGANLVIAPTSAITSSPGQQIVLIKNDGTDAVTGTFNGLAEGATLSVNGVTFRISYAGGAGGNDVTLTQTGGISYASDGIGGGALELRLSGSNLQFVDDGVIIDARPVANVTNQTVTVTGVNGQNETLFVNYGVGGFFDVDVAWNGGIGATDNDALRVGGGAFTTVTHTFTAGGPEHSGNIVYNTAAAAQSTISYTGLEPIDMSGSTISDLVFNSVGGNAVLEDDGTAGNNISQVRSIGGLFETTTFSTPTGSLTFNMGADSATFTVNSPDSSFNSSLNINGEGGTDSIVVSSALVLGSATSNGHLTLTAEGITLSANVRTDNSTTGTHGNVQLNGPVTLGANVTIDSDGTGTDGSVAFSSTINGDLANSKTLTITSGTGVLTFGGAIGGTASLGALSATSGGVLALPATTIGAGALSVTTTGAITQSGAIVVGGAATFAAGNTNNITLNNASNSFTTIGITSANNVVIVDTAATQLASHSVVGTYSLTSAGNISNSAGAAISVTGNASFNAGTGTIDLGSQAGDTVNFGSVTFNTTGTVTILEDSSTLLSGTSTALSLTLTASGAITNDVGASVTVTNNASFSSGANAITLGDQSGDAINFGSLTLTTTGAVDIREDSSTQFSGASTANSLALTSTGGVTNANNSSLTVTNNASFSAGANAITLGNQATDTINFGSLTLISSGTVTILEDSATAFAGTNTAGSLTLTSAGAITQTGPISVTGISSFTAGANAITLTNGSNNFVGAVSLFNSGTNAVAITDANAIVIGTSSVGTSTLVVNAIGITQIGTITQGANAGTATFNGGAGSIVLSAANDFTGPVHANVTGANNITINDAAGNLIVGTISAPNQIVTLTSTAGELVDDAAGNNVTAQTLNVSAVSGIGVSGAFGAIETTVSQLKALTATGGIAIDNTGPLTITDTGAFATPGGARVTGASGGITIRALSPLTVAADVTAPGAILLVASESAAATDHLTVNSGVLVQSTGASITLQAGDNITLNGGVTPQISASTTVTLNAASGDTDNLGGITANGAITAGGLVSLTARNTISLGANVTSTGGNLTYTSTVGAITRTAGTSSGNLLTASAAAGITLTTDVTTLNLTNTTSGNISVAEANDVNVALATTQAGNGSITIGAGGNIQLTGLVSANGSGAIDFLAQGELTLNDVVAGDDVISATGNIALRANAGVHINNARVTTAGDGLIDADANLAANTGPIDMTSAGLITVNNLVANAAQGITLWTSVNTLTATNTFSNAISVNEVNGVALNQVSNPGRDVFITLAAGAITDNNAAGQNIIGARSRLVGPSGIGTSGDALETTIGNLEASTSGGLYITETDALTIGGVTAANGITANASAVTIASGSLTLDEDVSTSGIVTFNSTGSVLETTGAVKNASRLNVTSATGQQLVGANTVASFDSTNSTSGDVTLLNTASNLTVVRIANLVGNATVSNSNNVQLGDSSGQNVNVSGIATIIASAGAITDGHTPTPDDAAPINNITAAGAVLSSSGTIGTVTNAIETAVARLEAVSDTTGGVFISEADGLIIGGLSPLLNGVSATTGNIRINSGSLDIQERVGTAGNVTLNSTGSIIESGAGFVSANLLTTVSNGGEVLGGPNTVGTFTATNTGAGSGILLENNAAGFVISTVTSQTGGDIYINNAGNGATVSGLVRSGNPILGGDITIQTNGLLTVNAVVDSRGGSGGTLTLGGQVNVNTSPIVGFGDVTLQGGPGTLNIFAPITVSSPLVLQSTVDVNILAKVETTSVLADITVLADMDGDGLGGVYVGQNGVNQGQLKAGRNLDVRGSEYQGTAPGTAALANLDNSIVLQPNGSTPRLEAVGNILVKNNGSAPFDAQIWLGGLVRSNTNGDVAFDNAVLVTSSSARVQSHSDGDVIFVGTVDSATGGTSPYNLSISGGEGVVLFNGAVGAVNPLGNVSIDSALDVTVASTFSAQSLVVTDATGTVEFGGAVTTSGTGTNLSVNAVTLLINGPINATAPGAVLGNILLQANNLTVANNVAGDGTLTIQPRDVDRSIGLNEAGDLNLDSSELDSIQNGFAQILIGRADGAGLISIGARTGPSAWQDPVVFRSSAAGGEIALLGETAGTDDASFTFLTPNITVDVPTSPAISTAGGFVQIGLFTATATTVLESDLEIQTAGGAVNIIGTINGANDLVINAGTGDVYLNGNTTPVPTGTSIGGNVPLNSISVTGDLLTLRPNMRSEGSQTYTGNSIHLLGGDFRTFGDGAGAIVFNGAVVLEGAITVTTTNSDIEFNGSVDNIALHTTTAGKGSLRLTAGNGNVLFGGDVGTTFAPKTIEVVSATLVELGNDLADTFKGGSLVTITAEEVDLAGDVSVPGGVLSITNKLDGQGILVGGTESASAELQLSDSDLAALGDGTASIVIGRRAGSGTADLVIAETATFRDPVVFQQPSKTSGSIIVNGDLVGLGNAGFTFNGPATRLNADITTAGGAIDIENVVGEAALSTIDTDGGAVTFRGLLKGLVGGEDITVNAGAGTIWLNNSSTTPLTGTLLGTLTLTNSGLTRIERGLTVGALVVDGGGTVALKGSITTTEVGGQDYDDAVRLLGSVNLTSRHADGVIHFGSAVDTDLAQPTKKYNLSVTNRSLSPTGTTVQFDGAVGALHTLGNLKINTTGDVIFGAAADIIATGISIRGDAFTVQDVTTTGAQVYYGAGTFDGTINALKLTVTSTIDIVNSGGTWVVSQLAALTAKNADISITGAGNTFGELTLRGVNATVEEAGNMVLRSTSLTGILDVTATATTEAGNISQGAAKVSAFRLEATAAGAINFIRPDTRLTQVGDMTSGADLTLLVRGARYVLLDGVITAIGDVLLAANPYGKGSSFSTGGNNITINAGGRWVVYSNYTQYPTDGTDLVAQLGPDFLISGESHPFAAPAGQNVLVFQRTVA